MPKNKTQSTTININQQPTFDLTEWTIISQSKDDRILFCQTKQIFQFDYCKGTIMPRSRVLRNDKLESQLVKNITTATIDAGFTGKLVFKLELTLLGWNTLEQVDKFNLVNFQAKIANSIQIDLNPFPTNYYGEGHSNFEADLQPDVVFKAEDLDKREELSEDKE